jgi:hypothetical protein
MPSESSAPSASIVVPTRARPDYLEVALASIAPQARRAAAELIVVDDAGASEPARELAERFGALYEAHGRPLGLNVARNTGVERTNGELVVFVDDDVEVCDGWLDALLAAACKHTDVEVFAGRILPRLEGSPPRGCGREGPPITSLDLGSQDTTTRFAWGANMAIRRAALDRVGPFDVSLEHGGDEQEWQERLAGKAPRAPAGLDESEASEASGGAPGLCANGHSRAGPVRYVAGAGLHHRRSPADARLRPLCQAAYARGRASRRFDAWREEAPSLAQELGTLAGCLGHVARRRCPAGLVTVAHSAGRLREALNRGAKRVSSADDFLSGESGTVGGLDGVLRTARDRGADSLEIASGRRRRLERDARRMPSTQRVLVLGIERPERSELARSIRAELGRSRHEVDVHFAPAGDRGKFENLNLLLESHRPREHDWLFAVDDDISLPRGFLDRFLFIAERFRLDLAQPAHRFVSHAAWQVTRRHPRSAVRETRFVEIGPLTALRNTTFSTLLPFPALRMGWGLDMHWAAVAQARGWRCGVIDATPISHRVAPAASAYSREQALAEARAFLERRPYLSASEAQQTLATHRRW